MDKMSRGTKIVLLIAIVAVVLFGTFKMYQQVRDKNNANNNVSSSETVDYSKTSNNNSNSSNAGGHVSDGTANTDSNAPKGSNPDIEGMNQDQVGQYYLDKAWNAYHDDSDTIDVSSCMQSHGYDVNSAGACAPNGQARYTDGAGKSCIILQNRVYGNEPQNVNGAQLSADGQWLTVCR